MLQPPSIIYLEKERKGEAEKGHESWKGGGDGEREMERYKKKEEERRWLRKGVRGIIYLGKEER